LIYAFIIKTDFCWLLFVTVFLSNKNKFDTDTETKQTAQTCAMQR